MPKHAPITDTVLRTSALVLSPLCLRLLQLSLAEVCGFAYACLPVSQTHGAGKEPKGARGRALHFLNHKEMPQ